MRATSCPDGLVSVPDCFRASALGLRFAEFGLALLLVCLLPACKPKELQALLEPSRALSTVLAEEAVRLAGAKKQIALITPDASWGPPSVIEEYLKGALKKHGVTVVIAKAADVGNPMFSGQIGLKANDFFEALEKSAGAGAVISLAGAPLLKPGDAERVSPDHPPVLVVATAMQGNKMGLRSDPEQLARLLEAKVIQLAIIDGADPAAPPAGKSDAAHALFAQNYSILRRPN
jgi:hypothetical protein